MCNSQLPCNSHRKSSSLWGEKWERKRKIKAKKWKKIQPVEIHLRLFNLHSVTRNSVISRVSHTYISRQNTDTDFRLQMCMKNTQSARPNCYIYVGMRDFLTRQAEFHSCRRPASRSFNNSREVLVTARHLGTRDVASRLLKRKRNNNRQSHWFICSLKIAFLTGKQVLMSLAGEIRDV